MTSYKKKKDNKTEKRKIKENRCPGCRGEVVFFTFTQDSKVYDSRTDHRFCPRIDVKCIFQVSLLKIAVVKETSLERR